MEVKIANDNDRERWEKFVRDSNGTIYHTFYWRNIVKDSIGFKPYFFYAEDNGMIKAICPFFLSKSMFFGKKLISVGDSVGPLGEEEACKEILIEAIRIGTDLSLDQIVIHDLKKEFIPEKENFVEPFGYISFLIDLNKDEKELFNNIQNYLRKGIRRELTRNKIEFIDIDSIDKMEIFYRIYQDNMHFIGTPPLPYIFFKLMFERLYPNRFFGFILKRNGIIAGSVINFIDYRAVRCYLSMIKSEFRNTNVNALLILETLKKSKSMSKVFDFGGSRPGSGNEIFKMKWNPRVVDRPWVYKLFNKNATITDPRDEKMQKYIKIWKKVPLFLCNIIGPRIRKMMGR